MTEDCQNLTPCPVRDGEPEGMLLRKQDHRKRGKEVMDSFKKVSMGDCQRWYHTFLVRWEKMLKTAGK